MRIKSIQTIIDILRGKTDLFATLGKALNYDCIKQEGDISIIRSYSQSGEDIILQILFGWSGKQIKSYLDIGACTVSDSNTYIFYRCGIKGVLVEANKEYIPMLKKYRPKDTILNVAITPDDVEYVDFYKDTVSVEEAKKRNQLDKITVPAKTITKVLEENFETYPDLLSIDIEGVDLDVLKTLDFEKYPIPVIIVETIDYGETIIRNKIPEIPEFMKSKGYFVYGDTWINTIFVNEKWFKTLNTNKRD